MCQSAYPSSSHPPSSQVSHRPPRLGDPAPWRCCFPTVWTIEPLCFAPEGSSDPWTGDIPTSPALLPVLQCWEHSHSWAHLNNFLLLAGSLPSQPASYILSVLLALETTSTGLLTSRELPWGRALGPLARGSTVPSMTPRRWVPNILWTPSSPPGPSGEQTKKTPWGQIFRPSLLCRGRRVMVTIKNKDEQEEIGSLSNEARLLAAQMRLQ